MLLPRARCVARSTAMPGCWGLSLRRHGARHGMRAIPSLATASQPLVRRVALTHHLFARQPKAFLATVRAVVARQASAVGLAAPLCAVFAAFAGGYSTWAWLGDGFDLDEDLELPPIPEPAEHFVHPFEDWSWLKKAWFVAKRSAFLAWTFLPFMYASTCVIIYPDSSACRIYWLDQMLECTERAGAAFQKFGQWLSMRPDMFPPDVIIALAKLRSDAPRHSAEFSRKQLRTHIGHDIEELFDEFAEVPVASGSVGQVHRAHLRPEFALDGPGGKLRDVAVKVQHPGVADSAFMDLDILWKVVAFSETYLHMTTPFNRGEFDMVIKQQMDFTREAFNLQRFSRNFKGERRIRFPKVSPKFATPEVLVETWAEGKVISSILEDFDNVALKAKSSCNGLIDDALSKLAERKRLMQTKLSRILYDMNMKMMVRDNFVHGDLHGGNILYSEGDNHVTIIDAGIATSLDRVTRKPFNQFLHALCSGHVDRIVDYLHKFNESKIKVVHSEFKSDIKDIMDKFMPHTPINAADMFGEVMFSMQKHGMLLKGDVASVLFTISISEGLIRQLDPTFDVAKNAIPYVLRFPL